MNRLLWVGLAALFVAPLVQAAEEAPAGPQAYVVLVGAGEFDDKQLKPRPAAVSDAQAMYDLVTDTKYLGVAPERVKLLITGLDNKRKAEKATKDNILKALRWVSANAKKDDLVLIGLYGQGASVGDRMCYFAADSTFKDRSKNAVLASDMEHELESLKSQKICAFIDINTKSFDAGKETVVDPSWSDLLKAFVGPEDKEEHTLPPGRVIFLASGTGTPSIDTDKGGIFTQALLAGLKGEADKEGYEADGLVTVDEIVKYLETAIPALARQKGKNAKEKEQLPLIWGSRSSHFELTRNPAETAKVEKAVNYLKELVKSGKIEASNLDEGLKLLNRMPKLNAQQELRKAYQAVTAGKITPEEFKTEREKILKKTELSKDAAEKFARTTLQAIRQVQREYVKEVDASDLVGHAIRGICRRIEVKVPDNVKGELEAAKKLKGLAQLQKLAETLVDFRLKLGAREDLADNKDIDMAMQMALSHLDPYTNYIDADQIKKFEQDMRGRFPGIGIQIRRDLVRDGLLVVTPIKGSPAYKAGVKAGDLVTTIIRRVDENGKPLEKEDRVSTKGMKVEDAVKIILGKPNTPVTIIVDRDGKELTFDIRRNWVEVETVLGYKRDTSDNWDYMIDPESKIAYIRLTQFQSRSAEDMEKVVKRLVAKENIKGLVLDLRFNPGGLLSAAKDICDLFIDDGLIVTIKPRAGQEQSYSGEREGSQTGFPMVCLVNGMSASGSEIVSACLQDHKRAIIIGERSYGKGSVQNIQDFASTNAKIKLTTATFWRPNGKNLNKATTKGTPEEDWGVRPDPGFEVPLTRKEREDLAEHLRDAEIISSEKSLATKNDFKDTQLEKALDYLREQIKMTSKTAKKVG